jgi:glycosyltransferase involved in cell wall biosynthesis
MKVLLNCHVPFPLAHGGAQVQTEQTKLALEKVGVEVECLRWWDASQKGDILHQIGRLEPWLVELAHAKGLKVAMTILLTAQCNYSSWQWFKRKLLIRPVLASPLPGKLKAKLEWRVYHLCDQMIVGLEAEKTVLEKVYGVDAGKIAVIPLGLAEAYRKAGPAPRSEDHLICSGTIGPAKNSIILAQLAHAAKTPMLFVGKPFDHQGPYWREFSKLIDGKIVKHHPHVSSRQELISLLQKSRGYVLMSLYENWSLAAHEAAACGLPMLVQDQRWSRERFGGKVSYWPKKGHEARARALAEFYEKCPGLSPPKIHFFSWEESALMLKDVYSRLLNKST